MERPTLTLPEAARIVREATKNKEYLAFPLGREWAEFLRAKRLAGCRANTIESYESVGDKFARYFADMQTLEPFAAKPTLILDFLDEFWADAGHDTMHHRFAVVASFFEWAYRSDRISRDPMRKVERPHRLRRQAVRARVSEVHFQLLLSSQESLRDAAGILLLGRLGLRREDLRLLQLRDISLTTDEVHLRHAKGGKEHVLPIAFKSVREGLYLHLQGRGGEPAEYLLYPKTRRLRPFSTAGIDNWFHRCLENAGLEGYTMHQLRHAAIDEVRRRTGDAEMARQLARHENLQTTQTYLHSSLEDLRVALEGMEVVEA